MPLLFDGLPQPEADQVEARRQLTPAAPDCRSHFFTPSPQQYRWALWMLWPSSRGRSLLQLGGARLELGGWEHLIAVGCRREKEEERRRTRLDSSKSFHEWQQP
eukprot:753466-Hanusia_phi.AAC.2